MPLDPFFAERLRVHRRYLFGQSLGRVRERLTRLGRIFARSAPAPASAATDPKRGGGRPRHATPRDRHRRAALAWDRKELATVGIPGPDLRTEEHTVPAPGFPDVRIRLYHPPGDHADALPAALTFFGGAFRIGGIDYPTTDAACRRRAAAADLIVVAVDYALAPEHRYPTQVEQSYAALDWVVRNAERLGIDTARLGIAGTSAGAAIAAAVTLMNRDRAWHPLRLQLLEVPVVDLTGAHIDVRATWALGIPSFLVGRELRSVARTYLPDRRDATAPYASPLRAASHKGLPPAVIMTAQYDPLRAQGAAYGAALRAAGVDATVVQYLGVTHDVPIFGGALAAARAWEAQAVTTLRTLRDDG